MYQVSQVFHKQKPKMGANVKVCPLYLLNSGKTKDILLDGIPVAKPPVVAGRLKVQKYSILLTLSVGFSNDFAIALKYIDL